MFNNLKDSPTQQKEPNMSLKHPLLLPVEDLVLQVVVVAMCEALVRVCSKALSPLLSGCIYEEA